MLQQAKVNQLLKRGISEVKAAGIVPGKIKPNVTINKKNVKRLGLCTRKYENGEVIYEIELNQILSGVEEHKVMEIVVHEILHTCEGCMNHGKLWKNYGKIMKMKYGYNITTTVCLKYLGLEREKGKYTLCCTNDKCGVKYEKNRMCKAIKHPERYRCSKCKSNLRLEVNSGAKQTAASKIATPRPTAKYVIECQKCKNKVTRTRMSKAVKNLSQYRCRCGGNLKLL